jgi:hypothetical protein
MAISPAVVLHWIFPTDIKQWPLSPVLILEKSQKLHEWHLGKMVAGVWLHFGSSPKLLYCKAGMIGHIVIEQESIVFPLLQCSERVHMRCQFCLLSVQSHIDLMSWLCRLWNDCFCSFTLACHCTPCCLVILDLCTGFTRLIKKITTTIDCSETYNFCCWFAWFAKEICA